MHSKFVFFLHVTQVVHLFWNDLYQILHQNSIQDLKGSVKYGTHISIIYNMAVIVVTFSSDKISQSASDSPPLTPNILV